MFLYESFVVFSFCYGESLFFLGSRRRFWKQFFNRCSKQLQVNLYRQRLSYFLPCFRFLPPFFVLLNKLTKNYGASCNPTCFLVLFFIFDQDTDWFPLYFKRTCYTQVLTSYVSIPNAQNQRCHDEDGNSSLRTELNENKRIARKPCNFHEVTFWDSTRVGFLDRQS